MLYDKPITPPKHVAPVRPMLAYKMDTLDELSTLTYPVLVSPKLDGIRCLTDSQGLPFGRKGESPENIRIVEQFNILKIPYLDGEFGYGEPTSPEFFNQSSRLWRSQDRDFGRATLYVFDRWLPGSYLERFLKLSEPFQSTDKLEIRILDQTICRSAEDVRCMEDRFVSEGYEGIIIRANLMAPYRQTRATKRTLELIKYKRFEDVEGRIIGLEQEYENQNERTTDALGYAKRSSNAEGLVPTGVVGVLLVESDKFPGTVLRIGTGQGLTHDLRRRMWVDQYLYIGRDITFAYQRGSDYTKPRFASFLRFND